MTTNCLMIPHADYKDRLFTSGPVRFPGVPHLTRDDFSAVIEKALAEPGFEWDTTVGEVMVGFGHNAVLAVAPTGHRGGQERRDPPLLPGRRLRRRASRAATTTPSSSRRRRATRSC